MLYSLEQVFLLFYNIPPIRSNHLMMKQSFKNINVKKDPDQKTIRFLFNKFEQTGIVADNLAENVGCRRLVMTPQNVQAIEVIVKSIPLKSIKRAADEGGFSSNTTYIIMRKGLKLFPYKNSVSSSYHKYSSATKRRV